MQQRDRHNQHDETHNGDTDTVGAARRLQHALDVIAEEWDDGDAFDCLDEAASGAAIARKPMWTRFRERVDELQLGWVPWAVAVVVLFFTAWSQSRVAARATSLAEEEQQHAEKVEAWKDEKQFILKENAAFMQRALDDGDLAEAVKALHSLRGFAENLDSSEFDSDIDAGRRRIALAVLQEIGFTQESLSELMASLPESNEKVN